MPNNGLYDYNEITNPYLQPSQAIPELLTVLTSSGFTPSDWAPGGFSQNVLQLSAYLYVAAQQRANTLQRQSIESTASGSFLDQLSLSFFANQRFLGTQAIINISIFNTSQDPLSFDQGQLPATFDNQYQFSNAVPFTINGQSSVVVPFIAGDVGVGYNVPSGDQISLGSAAASSLIATTEGIVVAGADYMPDTALHILNEEKWNVLSTVESAPGRAVYAIISASNGAISDAVIDTSNPNGPNSFVAYCSLPEAPASQQLVNSITSTLQSLIFNGNGQSLLGGPGVTNAWAEPSEAKPFGSEGINNGVNIFYAPGTNLQLLSSSMNQVLNFWVSQVPTGGFDITGSSQVPGSNGIADVNQLLWLLYQNCGPVGFRSINLGFSEGADFVGGGALPIVLNTNQKLTAPVAGSGGFNSGMWPSWLGNIAYNGSGPYPGSSGANLTASKR